MRTTVSRQVRRERPVMRLTKRQALLWDIQTWVAVAAAVFFALGGFAVWVLATDFGGSVCLEVISWYVAWCGIPRAKRWCTS